MSQTLFINRTDSSCMMIRYHVTYVIKISTSWHFAMIIIDGDGMNRCEVHEEKNRKCEKKRFHDLRDHSMDKIEVEREDRYR